MEPYIHMSACMDKIDSVQFNYVHLPSAAVREWQVREHPALRCPSFFWSFSVSYLCLCSLCHYAALSGDVEWLLVLWYYICISVMEEAIPVLSSLYESLSLKILEILICPNWSHTRRARPKAGDVCFELHNTCILLELSVMPVDSTRDDMIYTPVGCAWHLRYLYAWQRVGNSLQVHPCLPV